MCILITKVAMVVTHVYIYYQSSSAYNLCICIFLSIDTVKLGSPCRLLRDIYDRKYLKINHLVRGD